MDFSKVSYEQAVMRARTFGFVQDVEMLRTLGLAQGGSLENAIVMDEFRILNPGGCATAMNSSSTRFLTRWATSTCSARRSSRNIAP